MNKNIRLVCVLSLFLINNTALARIETVVLIESSLSNNAKSISNFILKYSSSVKLYTVSKDLYFIYNDIKDNIICDSPKYLIIIGKEILKDQEFNLSRIFSNSSIPEVIVSRLLVTNYKSLLDLFAKYDEFKSAERGNSKILTYDAFDILNDYSSIISHSIIIKHSHSSNLFNKLTSYHFSKDKGKLISMIVKHKPKYIIYVGHGNINGWENSNRLNNEFVQSIPRNYFFYNFDISCNTGKISKSSMYIEKLLSKSGGGSIAYIAPSIKVNYNDVNDLFTCFFENFSPTQTIGQNFLNFQKSLIKSRSSSLVLNYHLFGIPF